MITMALVLYLYIYVLWLINDSCSKGDTELYKTVRMLKKIQTDIQWGYYNDEK